MLEVKFIGFGGSMEVPCYEDENGKIYFDENNGRNGLSLYTGAYRDECDEICGEPNRRVTEEISCDNPFVCHEREADYRLLGRLKSDCDYFLGYRNAYEGYLYFMNIKKHCDEMEKLWKSFADYDKPEWLTLEQINEYREKMLDKRRKTK